MKFSIAIVRGAGFFGVLAIIVLSLVPGAYRPHTGLPGQAEHFIAYCSTALALTLGFSSIASRAVIAGGASRDGRAKADVPLGLQTYPLHRAGVRLLRVAASRGRQAALFHQRRRRTETKLKYIEYTA
jgi:hypothetical protein